MSMIENNTHKLKFENLYRDYRQLIFYKANEILQDKHLAEDAVHQAFIRIIQNLDKIDENNCHKTKGFIVIITENIAIDMYRKLKKEKTIPFEKIEYKIKDLSPSVEDIFEQNNESLLMKGIALLPSNYSSVIFLKYSHGYNNKEIGQILNISEENVRQRIFRGKKKLLEIIEEMEMKSYE